MGIVEVIKVYKSNSTSRTFLLDHDKTLWEYDKTLERWFSSADYFIIPDLGNNKEYSRRKYLKGAYLDRNTGTLKKDNEYWVPKEPHQYGMWGSVKMVKYGYPNDFTRGRWYELDIDEKYYFTWNKNISDLGYKWIPSLWKPDEDYIKVTPEELKDYVSKLRVIKELVL